MYGEAWAARQQPASPASQPAPPAWVTHHVAKCEQEQPFCAAQPQQRDPVVRVILPAKVGLHLHLQQQQQQEVWGQGLSMGRSVEGLGAMG